MPTLKDYRLKIAELEKRNKNQEAIIRGEYTKLDPRGNATIYNLRKKCAALEAEVINQEHKAKCLENELGHYQDGDRDFWEESDWSFSPRVQRILKERFPQMWESDFLKLDIETLLKLEGIGRKSCDEIKEQQDEIQFRREIEPIVESSVLKICDRLIDVLTKKLKGR